MSEVDAGLPEIEDGPDPWCTWCDDDVDPDGEHYRIRGRDDERWPPIFCSRRCASEWGNAAHQNRIYEYQPITNQSKQVQRGYSDE